MVTGSVGDSGGVDRLEVVFDDERLVADAGLVLPALLCERLDAKRVLDDAIGCERDRLVGQQSGAKALCPLSATSAPLVQAGSDGRHACSRRSI